MTKNECSWFLFEILNLAVHNRITVLKLTVCLSVCLLVCLLDCSSLFLCSTVCLIC